MLTKITIILFLCLSTSACCILGWGCKPNNNDDNDPFITPKWVKNRVPTDGEGAVGCDHSYANTHQQKDKAIRAAITELARQQGIHVVSKLNMEANDNNITTTFETTQGIKVIIKSKTHKYWKHPANIETCVWMKENQ